LTATGTWHFGLSTCIPKWNAGANQRRRTKDST
jgi:hypothetical protein